MPADYDGDKLKVWEQDYEPFIGYSDGGATVEIVYLDGIKVELFTKGLLGATPNFVALVFIAYMVIFVHSGSLWVTTCSVFAILCAAVWGFVFNGKVSCQFIFSHNLLTDLFSSKVQSIVFFF